MRGKGLFAGIELVKNKETREPLIPWTVRYYEQKHPFAGRLLGKLKEDGLFVEMRWNVLMVAPPLCIGKEDLDKGLGKIDQALAIADDFAKGDKG
ncbi:MAG: Taurine--pyruvate aminotransferase [Syntrophaceae bacterium PtaU1.Bin231]|nr:MAG: Taurine--pyruvate aminotransferase [Syntrophaceae bacterium PtaU1.Bin231]